jgi:hypothetical protein
LEPVSSWIADVTLAIHPEISGPRIDFFVVAQYLEKTFSLNGHIQFIAGLVVVALGKHLRHPYGLTAHAYLNTRWLLVTCCSCSSWQTKRLIHEIRKI